MHRPGPATDRLPASHSSDVITGKLIHLWRVMAVNHPQKKNFLQLPSHVFVVASVSIPILHAFERREFKYLAQISVI